MRNKKKTPTNAPNAHINPHQSENVDINNMCKLINYDDKLPTAQICPLEDVRKIRQKQEKNILRQMNLNNLELDFYDRFNRQIDSSIPIWSKIQQIHQLSNEEAVEQFRYYQSITVTECYSQEEEDNLMMGESRPNAGMFEDNHMYMQLKGEEMKDDYESILELRGKEEMEEELGENYYLQ